ncbi:MAG: NAD(P)-dependent oxidoreductase [Candidatus Omnitrophota bacterium]
MKKVLVTGGCGFFGRHLVKALIRAGYKVNILDKEEAGEPVFDGSAGFMKGDIRDNKAAKEACSGLDYVIHNAAILPISRVNRGIFREVNVEGTRNILKASLESGVKKVIFISSSAPYGIPKEIPINENTQFNPVCDYGRSKVEAENICNEYRKKGLNIIILRPRTIVGESRLGIFQILYSWIADNKNIYIIGSGKNPYAFLGIKDFIDACILSIEKDLENEDFNLGADKFGSVKEALEELINYSGSSSRIISLPARPAKLILGALDKLNLVPFTPWHYLTCDQPFYFDISKAKNMLGWSPQVGNFEMLKEDYGWYISLRKRVDFEFGTTHTKSVKQKFLKFLKKIS